MKRSCPAPVLIGFEGTRLNQTLQQHLLKINPAGIVLFKRNITSLEQTRLLISEVRDLLGPVLVGIDHEGGVVNRFPEGCPSPPSPMALNRLGNADLLRDACCMLADVLNYLGINLNFGPVLDLSTELRNPAIGTRAFSGSADEVATYGRVFVAAHENLRIGTTIKHFPGHGRSFTDSHVSAGEVEADEGTLRNKDMAPFRELISSGVPALMLAHLIYPALDPGVPAMFSPRIVNDLLRVEMGFQGLVISDCVEMSAVGDSYSPTEIASRGISAGVDLFISSFSLKKSCEFQVKLAEALRASAHDVTGKTGQQEHLELRLQKFDKAYPGNRDLPGQLEVEPSTVIQLHQQSFSKFRRGPIDKGRAGFFLLELSSREQLGINADDKPGPVAGGLLKELESIRRHRVLSSCNLQPDTDIIESANQEELTIILVTAGGHCYNGYPAFVKQFSKAESVVHISLLDERDLCGALDNEWVTWGSNAWTAPALARELALL